MDNTLWNKLPKHVLADPVVHACWRLAYSTGDADSAIIELIKALTDQKIVLLERLKLELETHTKPQIFALNDTCAKCGKSR